MEMYFFYERVFGHVRDLVTNQPSLVEKVETVQIHFTLEGEGLKGPKNLWMKNVHEILHGGLWIRVHGLPEFASGPPSRVGLTKIPGDHDF
jgi:hypothetical protein